MHSPALLATEPPPGPMWKATVWRRDSGLWDVHLSWGIPLVTEVLFLPDEMTEGWLPEQLRAVGTGPLGLLYDQACLERRETLLGLCPLGRSLLPLLHEAPRGQTPLRSLL